MKRLIAIVALLGLSLPATAATTTGDIEWVGDSPLIRRHQAVDEVVAGGFTYQTLGQFFHVVGPDGSEASYEIPRDAVGYSLADDGTVTFDLGEPVQTEPAPIADVSAEEWAAYVEAEPEQARRYAPVGVRPI